MRNPKRLFEILPDMILALLKWFKNRYKKTVTSIAFIPAIIAITFLLLSFIMIEFDSSPAGKDLKTSLKWLKLKDANTARSICTTIAGGIISLAVFSFSLVMILLNQAASLMSNRILDKLIGNRFQQFVLGFYIGTIVYALFLLSAIRDVNSGIYVPAISTYLLITFTIIDIFLFIYFLHYITQSVKYETIIHKVYVNTEKVMKKTCMLNIEPIAIQEPENAKVIGAYKSGIYQGFDKDNLIDLCEREQIIVYILHPVGTFLMQGVPIIKIEYEKDLSEDLEKQLSTVINIERGQEINSNYTYGLKHLMEIAIKALSPGINDPGTAIISLQAIGDLLAFKLIHFAHLEIKDSRGNTRVISKEKNFEETFEQYVMPIWDYGKNDRLIQYEMYNIITQLKGKRNESILNIMLDKVQLAIKKNKL